jgi:hypothetical protein
MRLGITSAKAAEEGQERKGELRVDGCPERECWCPDMGSVHRPMWTVENPQMESHDGGDRCFYYLLRQKPLATWFMLVS